MDRVQIHDCRYLTERRDADLTGLGQVVKEQDLVGLGLLHQRLDVRLLFVAAHLQLGTSSVAVVIVLTDRHVEHQLEQVAHPVCHRCPCSVGLGHHVATFGALTIGGFGASGENSKITKNHITVGMADATVEREELGTYVTRDGKITFLLRNPDFTTSNNIAQAINGAYPDSAVSIDAGTVQVKVPPSVLRHQIIGFISQIGVLDVEVDMPAVVVVNEKTGTIIIGQNVTISEVAIVHGSLSIIVEEQEFVSQPQPFSRAGTTATTDRTDITTVEENSQINVLPKQASVQEVSRALKSMGLSPRDIISIFESLRSAGALQAELRKI